MLSSNIAISSERECILSQDTCLHWISNNYIMFATKIIYS